MQPEFDERQGEWMVRIDLLALWRWLRKKLKRASSSEPSS
jgi:hypothetical protein